MARPRVKIDVVDTKEMRASRIMLDLMVKSITYRTPSSVATSGPIVNIGFPSNEKGRNNQRNTIRPFTGISRMKTFLRGTLANNTNRRERKRPGINAAHREHTAITTEKAATVMILTLGSREWITELPFM